MVGMSTQPGTPATKVRGLAAERGLTQEDVAVILGRTRQYIGKRYRGEHDFRTSELEKLATHFQVPVSTFFGEGS